MVMQDKFDILISKKRAMAVNSEITLGSEPGIRFYAMTAASAAIAAFGLIMDSTAIVIGAMLVAPLMTPIFGIALALVRGDTSLIAKSVRAEVAGVILAVTLSAFFGILMPEFRATEEMLGRTSPNLLDLLVAVFAGFAGAYAMVDEHISPALPGVAIATAIVPPLANTGLCLSLGAYQGAYGSFLLFFANFLSILLVASSIFFASGMAREFGAVTKKDIVQRFGLAAIGFIIVTALLSNGLYKMVHERRLKASILSVLTEEFSHLPTTGLQNIIHQKYRDNMYVLAHVYSPVNITPSQVKTMELALEKKLETPVELFVRSTLSTDISSTGSVNQMLTKTLDGFFYGQEADPKIVTLKLAEQIIREFIATRIGFNLQEVNLLNMKIGPVILATVEGFRQMNSDEIESLEALIRQRVGDDTLLLVVRFIEVDLYDKWGFVHYELSLLDRLSPEQEAVLEKIEETIKTTFAGSDYFISNLDVTLRAGVYYVLAELTGPRLYTQKELLDLKNMLSEIAGRQVKVYVRSIPEVVVTEDGYSSFDKLKSEFLKQTETIYKEELDKVVKEGL